MKTKTLIRLKQFVENAKEDSLNNKIRVDLDYCLELLDFEIKSNKLKSVSLRRLQKLKKL